MATKKSNTKRSSAAKTKTATKSEKIMKVSKKPQLKPTEMHNTSSVLSAENNQTKYPSQSPQKKSKRPLIAGIIIVLLILILLYTFRSSFLVATVNGQPITRMALDSELDKEAGKRALDALVTKDLILQEANRQHVIVSNKEIDDEIKNISTTLSRQGQTLNQALASRGITESDLRDQIKIEKLIEKLLGKQIAVSNKEATDYMSKYNSASNNNGTTADQSTASATPTLTLPQAKVQLQQQKLAAKLQPWIQQLQQKAKITYFVNFPNTSLGQ